MSELEEGGESTGDFIFRPEHVRSVLNMVERPARWEVIWAAAIDTGSVGPASSERLGYDVSYLPHSFFSVISDSMVFPRWHGTDREGVLFREHHDRLNQHALFDSPEDAQRFLDFYLAQDWTERGVFWIVEVRLMPLPL